MAKSKSKRVISFLLSALMILSSVGTNFFGLMPTSVVHADENYSGYLFPANSSGTDYGTCYVNDSGGTGKASSFSSSLGNSGPTIPNTLGDVSFDVQCWRHKGSEPDRKAHTLGSGTRNYEATWSTGPVEDGKITITWTLTKVYQPGHADAPHWIEPAASPMVIVSYRDTFHGSDDGGRIHFNFTIPKFGGIPISASTSSGQSSAAIESSIESQIQNKIQSYYSEYVGEALNGKKAITDPVYPTVIAHYDSSGPNVTISWLGYNIHYQTTSDPQRYYAKNSQSVWRPAEIELTAEKWVDPKSGTDKSSTSYSKACDIIGSSKCTFEVHKRTSSGGVDSKVVGTLKTDDSGNMTGNSIKIKIEDINSDGYWVKETESNAYQRGTKPDPKSMTFNGTALSKNSNDYWGPFYLKADQAGKKLVLSATNKTIPDVDPRITLQKDISVLPDWAIKAESKSQPAAKDAVFRIQFYDVPMNQSTLNANANKFAYLAALDKTSAKEAAQGSYSATGTPFYGDSYVNTNTVFPGNLTDIRSGLSARVTKAKSDASAGNLAIADYSKANYREFYIKTDTNGHILLSKSTPLYNDPNDANITSDAKHTNENNQPIFLPGVYVMTEVKGTDALYNNPMNVIILSLWKGDSNEFNEVQAMFGYSSDGANATVAPDSSNGNIYKSQVMNGQATTSYTDVSVAPTMKYFTQNEMPKGGSLTVEKSLEDTFPADGEGDDTGHGKDKAHDGDSDGDITTLETTMQLYYAKENAADGYAVGRYWEHGAHNSGTHTSEPKILDTQNGKTDVLVTTFKTTKKSGVATGEKYSMHYGKSTDPEYKLNQATVGNYVYDFADLSLSLGKYYIIETQVPAGTVNLHGDYANRIQFEVEADKRTVKTTNVKYTKSKKDESVDNRPIEASIKIRKSLTEVDDAAANKNKNGTNTQAVQKAARISEGDIDLKNAVFEIRNKSVNPVWVSEKQQWRAVDEVVGYLITDSNGETGAIYDYDSYTPSTQTINLSGKKTIKLPYGTYQIQEVKAPTGAKIDTKTNAEMKKQANWLKARADGQTYNYVYAADTYITKGERKADGFRFEDVDRGGFSIEKVDAETGERVPQGNATFENTRFILYNMSAWPVWVDLDGDGDDTDADEWFAGTEHAGITTGGQTINPKAGGTAIVNTHNKYALDANGNKTDDYTFRLDQISGTDGLPGYWSSPRNFLPYGTYRLVEVASTDNHDPDGYHNNDEWSFDFEIRKDGTFFAITDMTDKNNNGAIDYVQAKAVRNLVERAGIQVQKYDKEDHSLKQHGDATLEGAVFAIYNTSSYKDESVYGEMNGYVVTDQNHNGAIDADEAKDYIYAVTDTQIDEMFANGTLNETTWAGTADDGTVVRPAVIITTDANGIAKTSNVALPYGDYVIREVKAPAGYHIDRNYNVHFTITYDESVSETQFSKDSRSDYRITSDWKYNPKAVDRSTDISTSGQSSKADASGNHSKFTEKAYTYTYTNRGKANTITGIGADYAATPKIYQDYRYNAAYMLPEQRSSAYEAILRGTFVLQKVDMDDYEAYKVNDYAHGKNGALNYDYLYVDSEGRYVVEPQGDAKFANTEFRVINRSAAPIYILTSDATGNSVYTKIAKDDVAWTFKTDENGYYEAPDDLLPYGTYEIQEVAPPEGYRNSQDSQPESFTFTIGRDLDGQSRPITYNKERDELTAENDLQIDIPGYTLYKIQANQYKLKSNATNDFVTNKTITIKNKDIIDSYTDDTKVMKDDMYIFENSVTANTGFRMVKNKEDSEADELKTFAEGEDIVYNLSVGKDGIVMMKQIVSTQYGSHYTVEGGVNQTMTVKLDDYTAKFLVNLETDDNYSFYPFEDDVIRGGVEVLKVDEDDFQNTGEHNGPQADARFEGAEFSIYNIGNHYVWVEDEQGNWRRTYPATADGAWIAQDDVEADSVYDPEEAHTRLAFNKLSAITDTGMTNDAKSTQSDNKAYTDIIEEHCGATTVEGVIDKYHDNHNNNEVLDKARLGNNDLQDILTHTVPVKKIYTDATGKATTGNYDLPYGTYIIYETAPSKGYHLPRCWYRIFEIREDGHIVAWDEQDNKKLINVKDKETNEPVIRGDVQITKFDAETKVSNALAPDALSGIKFRIYNVSDNYDYLWELTGNKREPLVDTSKTEYNTPLKIINSEYFNHETSDFWNKLDSDPNCYVMTIETKWNADLQAYTAETFVRNEDDTKNQGTDKSIPDVIRGALPYGTYIIRECETNTKYEFTDGYPWIFSIREEGEVVNIGYTSGDQPGVNEKHPIEFYDKIERNDVWFNKIEDANSRRMDTMWVIKNNDTLERHVIVTNGGSDDSEDSNGTYESAADVNSHTWNTNANDKFLKYIDENGLLDTDTETITEKDFKDESYTGDKTLPVAITMGGKDAHDPIHTENTPGSVDGTVVHDNFDGLDNNGLGYAEYDAGTWFGVGEFTIWDGDEYRGAVVNPHIISERAEKQIVTTDPTTGEEVIQVYAKPDDAYKALPYGHYTISEVRTDSNQGLILQEYNFTVNNENRNRKIWAQELEVKAREIDLGTITDDAQPKLELSTLLTDTKTESHVANGDSDNVTLNEEVEYVVTEGEVSYFAKDTFKLDAELHLVNVDEEGNETLGDLIATATQEGFKIKSMNGKTNLKYTFNGTEKDLEGKKVVSIVKLYRTEKDGKALDTPKLVSSAENASEVNEQVFFPEITSDFRVSATDNKVVPDTTNAVITDKITATNLYPDTKYAVKAVLMTIDEEGKAVPVKDADGNNIETPISDIKFITETTGEFYATFKGVDVTGLKGKSLVAYAYLYAGSDFSEPVAKHEKIDDKKETVYVPEIHTDAIDGVSGDQQGVCIETDKIIDTVEYKNLVPGEYTMQATLFEVDAEGNATALMTGEGENSKPIIGTKAFTVTASEEGEDADILPVNGTVDVTLNVNSKEYAGKTVVVYETLYAGKVTKEDDTATEGDATEGDAEEETSDDVSTLIKLAEHTEATDTRQQIHYPEIHTTANDKNTETKSALAIKDTELIDTVEFHNLIVGNSYVFRGTLMTVDADGNATEVLNDGKPIVVESEPMTAETTDGKKDLVFKYDATEYKGKDIVVFEKLLSGKNTDIEYTQHEDITDEGQTVHFPEIGTTAKDAQTGKNFGYATENTTIVDTVHYHNLVSGVTYEVIGTLYDKESGKPIGVVKTDDTDDKTDDEPETPIDVDIEGKRELVVGKDIDAGIYKLTGSKREDGTVWGYWCVYASKDGKTVPEERTTETCVHNGIEMDGDASYVRLIDNMVLQLDKWAVYEKADDADESVLDKHVEDFIKGLETTDATTTDATVTDADEPTETDATDTDADTDGEKYVTGKTKFIAAGKDGDIDVTLTFNAVPFRGRDVVVFEELYVYKPDGTKVKVPLAEHKDITDEGQTIHYPEIGTEAFEKNTGLHETKAETKLVLVDKVKYTNVVPNVEYTVTGTLMDKETNQPVLDAQGNVVTATKTITPTEKDGYAEVEFEFDASNMRGKTTVAFETWSWNNIELAVHADIEDKPQTVYFPDISTTATSGTSNSKLLDPIDVEVIKDEISYKNVIVGHKYKIEGYLVDVETGEVLKDAKGNEFRNSVEFTAETTEGKISMDFGKMNAAEFAGKQIVVYESIYNIDGKNPVSLVDEHVKENKEQTVAVTKPAVKTLLGEAETGNKALAANDKVKLVDTIEYTDLIPGNTYKTVSTLVYADNGETVKDNKGKDLVVEATVTPEKSAIVGTAEFNFDGSNLKGKVVVAYEDVYRVIDGKEYLIAQERDLKNEDQTVTFPDLHTTATSALTHNHTLEKATKAVIEDKVEYSGLQVGHTYKLKGTLMDKETGKAVEGVEEVTTEFTPTETNGFVIMQVTVDTTKLEGHHLVMFETCYENDKELVIHADIEDEEQTVTVCELHTKATGADGKSKTVDVSKNTVIKDTVEFKGLTPGKTYVLYGEVYSKEQYTGTEVKGKEKTNNGTTQSTTQQTTTEETPAADATNFTENGEVKTATVDGLMIEMPKDTVGAIGMPENRMRFDKVTYAVNDSDGTASFTLRGKLAYRAKGSIVDDWRVSAKCVDGKNNVIETVTVKIDSGIKDATKSKVFTVTTSIPLETKKVIIVDNAVDSGVTLNPVPAGETTTQATTQATTEATTQATTQATTETKSSDTKVTTNVGNAKPLATNTIEFTPKEADGEVEIEFTVDTTSLDGHHLVCFETVTEKDTKALIGEHKDINDEDQTVTVKTTTTVQTGVDRFALLFTILSILLMIATVGGYAYLKRNKKVLVLDTKAEVIDLNDTDEK